jgi:hypothetical protein
VWNALDYNGDYKSLTYTCSPAYQSRILIIYRDCVFSTKFQSTSGSNKYKNQVISREHVFYLQLLPSSPSALRMSPAPSYFDKPTGLTNGHSATNVTSLKLRHDGFGTRAIHVGSEPNSETGAVIPPISLATTYKQDGVGKHKVRTEMAPLFFRPLTLPIFTRDSNIPALEIPTEMPWNPLSLPSREEPLASLSPQDRQPPPR